MKYLRKEGGFTLIEIVVVLAVIAMLSAILAPLVLKYIDDAKFLRATKETEVLAASLFNGLKDIDKFPICKNGANPCDGANAYALLYTGAFGDLPTGLAGGLEVVGDQDKLSNHLELNQPGGLVANKYPDTGRFRWRGRYLQDVDQLKDPWSRSYVVITAGMKSGAEAGTRAWVCTGGPNQKLDTTALTDVAVDDVCSPIIKR